MFDNAGAHGIDQGIDLKTIVKKDLTAHGRNSEGISIIADSFDNTAHEPAGFGVVWIPKAQAVQLGNGSGSHGENIPVDTTHAGGSALVGLDRRRVIVRFDFESAGQAIADIHQPRIFFPRLGQHAFAVLGQGF